MAYNSASTAQTFYVEIQLSGLTLYLSTEYRTLDDGTPIDGLLVSVSPLERSAGSLLEPRVVLPSMSLSIDNKPDQDGTRFQDYFVDYEWANAPVLLRVGNGTAASSYEAVFTGGVKFPGGTGFDDEMATVYVNDARSADARTLPPRVFSLDDYPNMDPAAVDEPIPLMYGDFTSSAGNGETVPCTLTDSTVGLGGYWTIADHALAQIEYVYADDVSSSFTADLSNGGFTLDVAVDLTTVTVTAHAQGATSDGTPTGDLLTTAPGALNDLLQTWLEVSSDNINSDAFDAWGDELTAYDVVRRLINTETSSDTLIAQLLSDTFSDLTTVAAQYYPSYRLVDPDADLPAFYAEDLLRNEGSGVRSFSVDEYPESVVANEITGYYSQDPVSGSYNERYLASDDDAIARVGQRVRRVLYMTWLYHETGGRQRTEREAFAFAGNVDMAHVGVGAAAVTLRPASQFRLIYSRYEEIGGLGNPFQVRDVSLDPVRRRVKLSAWDMASLSAGTWTEDAAVTWLTATSAQRRRQGFWADDDGYADTSATPDEASKRYRWS